MDEVLFVSGGRAAVPEPFTVKPKEKPVDIIVVRPHPDQLNRQIDLHIANVTSYYAGRLSDADQGGGEIVPGFQELYDLMKAGMQEEVKAKVLRALPKVRALLARIPTSEDSEMFWHPQYGVMTDMR
jgi:hypothetical protein